MFPDQTTSIKPLEILELLRGYPFLADYFLALFHEKDGIVTRLGAGGGLCGLLAANLHCGEKCESSFEKAVSLAVDKGKPMVFSCRAGLMNFAVPYQPRDGIRYCFVGGGVRNRTLDVFMAEEMAKTDQSDAFQLLDRLEELPAVTIQDVKDAAGKVARLLAAMDTESLQSRLLEKTMERLQAIAGIASQIDRTPSVPDMLELLKESLGVVFDRSKIAIGLCEGRECRVSGLAGLPVTLQTLPEGGLGLLFPPDRIASVRLTAKMLGHCFPGIGAGHGVCVPLASGEELAGFLAFFDADINPRECLLVSMLAERIAARIVQFRRDEARRRESSLASRFMAVLSAISAAESRREVYQSILETAADLIRASSGSLMLVDESGRNLRIESVKGMNLQLARSMSARVGRGIAGKVAETGEPLLVTDIEQDSRVRIANRTRFRTKSFLSIPLRVKGSVVGVLNLSDKGDGAVFTAEDLELLTEVARYACVVLERTEFSEKAARLEDMTVTDPLTGLYNRRYLDLRLEEEISRGVRHKQDLTLMLVDLDNFKVYNDLCGHAAGDVVLKKTARLLKNCARQMDIVTRISGERFCIILPATPGKDSLGVAERFRFEVERAGFTHEENLPLGRLTVSIGLSSFPENGSDVSTLVSAAEMALHRAKVAGRNRVVHFDASPSPQSPATAGHAQAPSLVKARA